MKTLFTVLILALLTGCGQNGEMAREAAKFVMHCDTKVTAMSHMVGEFQKDGTTRTVNEITLTCDSQGAKE